MRTRKLLLGAALCGLGISACSADGIAGVSCETSSASIQAGCLSAVARSDGIFLTNQTERTVFYMAFNVEMLALLDWAPCVEDQCDPIAPGASKLIPWRNVAGYDEGAKDYGVTWWHAEMRSDGTKVPGEFHRIDITR